MSADLRREFQALFDAEFSYVCRALSRLGVRDRDLEDVAQEVFVSVHGKFASYDRALPPKPWLFAFALRAASNYQRLARHRREVTAPEAHERAAEGTPEQTLVERQMQARVLLALEGVPLDRRSVLIMHDIDGISAPEISAALSIPVNTVYSRVRVAREEFRDALKREQLKGGER